MKSNRISCVLLCVLSVFYLRCWLQSAVCLCRLVCDLLLPCACLRCLHVSALFEFRIRRWNFQLQQPRYRHTVHTHATEGRSGSTQGKRHKGDERHGDEYNAQWTAARMRCNSHTSHRMRMCSSRIDAIQIVGVHLRICARQLIQPPTKLDNKTATQRGKRQAQWPG